MSRDANAGQSGECKPRDDYGGEVRKALDLLAEVDRERREEAARLAVGITAVAEEQLKKCFGRTSLGLADGQGNIFINSSYGDVRLKAAIIAHELVHARHREQEGRKQQNWLIQRLWNWEVEEAEAHRVGNRVAVRLGVRPPGYLQERILLSEVPWGMGVVGALLLVVGVATLRWRVRRGIPNPVTNAKHRYSIPFTAEAPLIAQSSRTYRYRWLVLVVFMLAAAINQAAWITFAPVTSQAMAFFGTSDLKIGLLSMVFMVVYIVAVLPSAWSIDTLGFRAAVGIGITCTALGALGRGLFAGSFAAVFVSQIVIAVGQAPIVGPTTKLASRWFAPNERATATGLGTLSMYLGILAGMVVTPLLTARLGMKGMLLAWGLAASVVAALFFLFSREHPPTPPSPPDMEERTLVLTGLKKMLSNHDFLLVLAIFFMGLGAFNGVTTWIEQIVRPRGFGDVQAGATGGIMLLGGVLGALIIPIISDGWRSRRKPFFIICLVGLLPGLLGIIFAWSYWLLLASGFAFGFFLLALGPVGCQYVAEITHPAPEGTSNSFLLLMGQVSGIVVIFGMDAFKAADGSMTVPLLGLLGCMLLCVVLSLFLRESPVANQPRPQGTTGVSS